jgi:hypothetical protein
MKYQVRCPECGPDPNTAGPESEHRTYKRDSRSEAEQDLRIHVRYKGHEEAEVIEVDPDA